MSNLLFDFISGTGKAIGAPVIFDWDTNAAREDAANGARNSDGSYKRGAGTVAYDQLNKKKEYSRSNGNIYNYAGDVIGKYTEGNDLKDIKREKDTDKIDGGASFAERDATIGMIDDEMARIDSGLSNLDATRNAGVGQIDSRANKARNRLGQMHATNQTRFNTKESDTKRDFSRSTEDININAGNVYRAVQNLLGRAGAGRSSAAQEVAPYAVSQDASKSRGEVADVYSTNHRDIRQARDEEEDSFKNSNQDINDQQKQELFSLENDILSKRSKLHQTRAGLAAKRAMANGGNWDRAKSEMAADVRARDDIDRAVANLLNDPKYSSIYSLEKYQAKDPALANYATDLNGVEVTDPNGKGFDTDTSSDYLTRIREEEELRKRGVQA